MRVLVALAAALLALTAASAQAAQTTYRVDDVRTAKQRAAVARTGAAIVEVDHGSVTVTASRSDLRALRRAGFKVVSSARKSDFPSADSAYHNYTEMSNEVTAVTNANPAIARRLSPAIGTSYQGRELVAAKLSDNVGTDEAEPEVLFTCGQHAREHLTIEMCLYMLNEFTSKYATDAKIKQLVDSREIWIVFNLNPDGARVRHRHRLLSLLAQEPAAELGLERGRHRSQSQLELPVGLLRRLERHVLVGDLPRPVGVLGAGDRAGARFRQQPRHRRRAADHGRTSTSTPTPS